MNVVSGPNATIHNHPPEPKQRTWTIPRPSAYATGQDEYLAQVRQILEAGDTGGITQPTGLRGFGGIGKTELALAYAQHHADAYDVGHLITADSPTNLKLGLSKIADPSLPPNADDELIATKARQALNDLASLDRLLMIFDNVDELVQINEFKTVLSSLPRAHIILTCRHSDMGAGVCQVEVKKMGEGVGALYVLRLGLGDQTRGPWEWDQFKETDRSEAKGIARELDGLPLALHHAGSAIRAEQLSVREVLADYQANRARILNNRGQDAETTHPDSATLTVIRALERLREKDPAAAELVVCCAFLAPDAISEDLFTQGIVHAGEPLASRMDEFAAIRSAALRSALIDRPTEGTLTIHRVTQAIVQDAEWVDPVSRLTEVTNRCVTALYHAGRYHEMAAHAELGAQERKRRLGERHPDTLTSMNNLASTYGSLGRHADALRLQEEALAARKEVLGERHPDTLGSMGNLASTYWSLGRYADALRLDEEVLAVRKEVQGGRHPDTLMSMSNLASTYGSLGRHADALRLQEEVLAASKEVLGDRHPQTLTSMNNLAETYGSLGRHADALRLHEEVLAASKEVLGDRHPDTLRSMSNLAETYRSLRRHADALRLQEEVLAARKEVQGERHPDTLMSMNNLAGTYEAMGQYGKAKELYEQALAGLESTLGPDHPDTKLVRANLEQCRAKKQPLGLRRVLAALNRAR